MTRAAALNRVPLNVLYSVGLTETGRTGELSPYDMNIDGKAIHSASAAEAMTRFNQAKARGAKLIDVGCMQINHHWHSADFASLSEMFNPVRLDDPPLPAERPRVRGPAAKSGRDHVADDRADVSALHRRIVWPGVIARDRQGQGPLLAAKEASPASCSSPSRRTEGGSCCDPSRDSEPSPSHTSSSSSRSHARRRRECATPSC